MKRLIYQSTAPLLTVLLFTLISCNEQAQQDNQKSGGSAEGNKIQRVEVVKPARRLFTAEVLIAGTARPNQVVSLHAMEGGMISRLPKDIGDKVKKGEVLAFLENPNIEYLMDEAKSGVAQAKANLASAVAQKDAAEALYSRLDSIHDKTPALTTQAELDNAKADFWTSSAAVERAQAMLEVAQQKLTTATKRAGFLQVKAPFPGIITKRFVDNGAMVQSGLNQTEPQALFELQAIDPIRVIIPVPESDAVGIREGMPVQVTLPELSGEPFTAEVSRMAGALDPMSKTMQVEIDLENPNGKILSGVYAKALLKINSRDNILSLPMMTKVSFKNEDYVLTVEEGKVRRVQVKTGLSNRDYFEVLNAELTPETQVIVQGKSLVKPGQIVEPVLKLQ